jgi:hypothetical protein
MNAEVGDPDRAAADRDWTAERAPSSVSGLAAVTSVLRMVDITTAVAVMAVATAVVDGNAA